MTRILGDFPGAAEIIRNTKHLMATTRVEADARVNLVRGNERLEASADTLLEALLGGDAPLPEDRFERALMLLFLADTAHRFPSLRDRIAREDAREFFGRAVGELIRESERGVG